MSAPLTPNKFQRLLMIVSAGFLIYMQYTNWDRPTEGIALIHYHMVSGWSFLIGFGLLGLERHIHSIRLAKQIQTTLRQSATSTNAIIATAQLNLSFAVYKRGFWQNVFLIAAIGSLIYGLYKLTTTADDLTAHLHSVDMTILCYYFTVGLLYLERLLQCSRLEKLLKNLEPLPTETTTASLPTYAPDKTRPS